MGSNAVPNIFEKTTVILRELSGEIWEYFIGGGERRLMPFSI
jgi:hypothetical protein